MNCILLKKVVQNVGDLDADIIFSKKSIFYILPDSVDICVDWR